MAALISPHTSRHIRSEPQRPVGPTARPTLRVIEGGRSPVLRRTYLRRRLIVATGAVLVLLVGGQLVANVAGADSGPAVVPVSEQRHVVRPGDTLWSIAGELAPEVDRRVAVDDLIALNGDDTLQVGQQLVVPDGWS